MVAGLDLILRWVVLRMADGNMQSLVRVLELARALLCALRDAGGHLTELDALVFLPAIVEKAGHGQVSCWCWWKVKGARTEELQCIDEWV